MFSCHGRYVLHKVAGLAWLAIALGLRDDAWNGAFSTSGLLRELIDISTVILDHKRASRELLNIITRLGGGGGGWECATCVQCAGFSSDLGRLMP